MRPTLFRAFCLATVFSSAQVFAYAGGIVGYSGQTVGTSCVSCHAATTGTAPTVAITGPATLAPGATGNYTFTITGGPGVRGGYNLSKDVAGGQLQAGDTTSQASAGELTHQGAKNFAGGSVSWAFRLVAPATAGAVRLFASGNSANNAGGAGGDREALTTLTVNVTAANAPPTVATAAAAAQTNITGTQVGLTVLGADDNGEGALTYTWAGTGPAAVTFTTNASNAAKATTANFTRAGAYTLTATIRDAGGATVTSAVNVTVAQTLTQIAVSPSAAGVSPSATQQFLASGTDQFGQAQSTAVAWTVSGGGTISTGGLFTASATPGGPYTITATQAGKTGTAQITVSAGTPPVVTAPAAAAQNPVTTTTVALSVTGTDDGGAANILYTWAAMAPIAPVTFSVNGTNAARNTVATFTRAGQYTFTVTLRDGVGLTSTSTVVVDVSAAVATIQVSPASITVATNATTQFTASAMDQFATPITPAPAFAWAVTGGGTISSAGLFRASNNAGGPFTVSATSGGQQGMGMVTVSRTTGPTVAQAPVASPELVTGRTTSLRVLGADGSGEATLSYRWTATGPGSVTFAPNDVNAAKLSTATFSAAGDYVVTVSVVNGSGQTATATLPVSVRQALSGLTVSPSTATVSPGAAFDFAAQQIDQFGMALTTPIDVQWTVSGGGTIDTLGKFTARDVSGGPFVVSASASGLRSTAQVTIGPGSVSIVPPTVSIVGPTNNMRAQGFLHLKFEATAAVGLRSVELLIDGTRLALLTQAPYELELDTQQFADGSHVLDAVATDTAGNVANAQSIRVYFRNSDAPPEEVIGEVGCTSTGASLFAFALSALLPLLRKGSRKTRR